MSERGRPRHPDILTPREWEVLALVREGCTNGEIAERLGITERTAKFHVSEILGKLELRTREEIATWNGSKRRLTWSLLTPIGAGAMMAAALAVVAALAVGVVQTESDASSLNLQPGDVMHYTTLTWDEVSGTEPQNSETWMLIGEEFNEEKARVYGYGNENIIRQDGWSDAASGVTSGSGGKIDRPHFRSIFMWEDEETVGMDILRSSKPPGVTPAPGEEQFAFVGYDEVAGVTTRVYEHRDGDYIRHVYISDDPFGLWFGERIYETGSSGPELLTAELWLTTSFEVISLDEVPPGTFDFPAPGRIGTDPCEEPGSSSFSVC